MSTCKCFVKHIEENRFLCISPPTLPPITAVLVVDVINSLHDTSLVKAFVDATIIYWMRATKRSSQRYFLTLGPDHYVAMPAILSGDTFRDQYRSFVCMEHIKRFAQEIEWNKTLRLLTCPIYIYKTLWNDKKMITLCMDQTGMLNFRPYVSPKTFRKIIKPLLSYRVHS